MQLIILAKVSTVLRIVDGLDLFDDKEPEISSKTRLFVVMIRDFSLHATPSPAPQDSPHSSPPPQSDQEREHPRDRGSL